MKQLLRVIPLILLGACASKTQTSTKETLKIGALLPYSGALSARGTVYENGIRAAISTINDQGGVLNKNLDLVTQDTNTAPASLAVDAATALLPKVGAHLMLGPIASGQLLGLATWATNNNTLILSPTAGSDLIDGLAANTLIWHSTGEAKNRYRAEALDMKALGLHKIVVMQSDKAAFADNPNLLSAYLTPLDSTATVQAVVYTSQSDYTSWDPTTWANQARALSPDAIVLNGDGTKDAAALITNLRTNGYTGTLYTGGSSGLAVTIAGNTTSQGTRTVFTSPPSQADVDAYKAAYAEWNNGTGPDNDQNQSFDSTVWLAFAIQKAGSFDAAAVAAALPKIVDPAGVSVGPTDLKAGFAAIAAGHNLRWRGANGAFLLDATRNPVGAVGIYACCTTDAASANPPYSVAPVATFTPDQ